MFHVGSPNKTYDQPSPKYVTSCNEPTGETALIVRHYRRMWTPVTHLERNAAINLPNSRVTN
jgi:hypothetical protein